MQSKIAEPLKPCDFDEDIYESEPFAIPYFDNLQLRISFSYILEEPYFEAAEKTLQNFLNLNTSNRIQDSAKVYEYYTAAFGYSYTEPLAIEKPDDVWNFVTPTELSVAEEDGTYYVCVSCECDWEEEHGLYMVFTDGQVLTKYGGHDGHLRD